MRHAAPVELDQTGMGLDVTLMLDGRPKRVLEDLGARSKRPLDLLLARPPYRRGHAVRVIRHLLGWRGPGPDGLGLVDQGRPRLHRLDRVEHPWQLFVLDVDKGERLFSCLSVLGRDRCHFLPDEPHLVPS